VTIDGQTSWNCRGEGLPIDSGDRVQQHVRGRPTDPSLTGGIEGLGGVRVRCQNFSTGQSLQFLLAGAESFDCRSRGLLFSGGDLLGWTATGSAD
jgi:hypothetical protein